MMTRRIERAVCFETLLSTPPPELIMPPHIRRVALRLRRIRADVPPPVRVACLCCVLYIAV